MRNKKVLLIGVTGFIGKNLAHYLIQKGFFVYGTFVHEHKPSASDHFSRKIKLIQCDSTDKSRLKAVLKKIRPKDIYYLAAQSSVKTSWLNPAQTIQINFLGGVHLLEIVYQLGLKTKVVIFSSGTAYGDSHRSGLHLKEGACLKPKDPYGVSKAALDIFSRFYALNYGLDVVVVRLANITGPGQLPHFSIPNFASQIVKIEKKLCAPTIRVGNLNAKRDFVDIRDCLRALLLVMTKGRPGEAYNIASGITVSLRDIFNKMLRLSRLDIKKIDVQVASQLIPKDEIAEIRLNPLKLKAATNWKCQFNIEDTLTDILNEWRDKDVVPK